MISHEDDRPKIVPPSYLLLLIQKSVPQAVDAFSSPNGDLLAVLNPTEILVFTPKGGVLGIPALKFPLKNHEAAVMAQWATAVNISRWNKILAEIK